MEGVGTGGNAPRSTERPSASAPPAGPDQDVNTVRIKSSSAAALPPAGCISESNLLFSLLTSDLSAGLQERGHLRGSGDLQLSGGLAGRSLSYR